MARRVVALVVAVLVVGGLVACGGAPPPQGTVVTGEAVGWAGAPVLGVGFAMADISVISTADLIEVGTGTYVTGLQPVAADGGFRLTLPAPEDLPPGVLAPADAFLFDPPPGCALAADPASARVSGQIVSEKGVLPGFVAVSTDGLAFAMVTETPIDMSDPGEYGGRFLVWLYADGPVAVEAVGAGCAGALDLALTLRAGWNAVGWTYDKLANAFTVRDAPGVGDVIVSMFPPTP